MPRTLDGPKERALVTARWATQPAQLLDDCHRRYGPNFSLDLVKFGRADFFASPQAAQDLFRAAPPTYRAGKTKFVRPILGPNSLLCLDGDEHLRQRRLLLPALHGQRLAGYADLTRDIVEAELATWPVGRPFPLLGPMQRIALAVMLRTVFGLAGGPERDRVGQAVLTMMHGATESRSQLIRMAARRDLAAAPAPGSRLGRLLGEADAAVFAAIDRRRDEAADGDDVLSMLLSARDEAGQSMTDEELRDELLTLLLAGYETTAASLSWLFERLLRHPEAWDRVRSDARAGEQDYLAAAVTETLRTRPVLWLAGRTLLEPAIVDGYELPAGSLAYLCSYVLHRRDDLYPDALRFRPERWLGGRRGAYTFVPFGGGLRRCIGAAFAELELRTVLATVASTCDLEALRPARDERFRRRGIVLVPDRGTEVVLRARR